VPDSAIGEGTDGLGAFDAGARMTSIGYSCATAAEDLLKPVLLVIDVLVDYLDAWPEADRASLIDAIRSVIGVFRDAGHPIIWVRQEFSPDLSDAFLEMRRRNIRITIEGTPGSKIVPELLPHPEDGQVIKKRYSAFFGTDLDERLLAHAADTVVLAGINTHACVRATAIDAYQRDLDVIIPLEAVGSYDRDHAAMSLRYMDRRIASVVALHALKQSITESSLQS
jgi:nicotinamidase-related amidase